MKHKQGGSPYSMDANLLHISFEGRHLENPAAEAEESMWRWTVSPEAAPDAAEYVDLEFEKGDLVAINGTRMKPHELLAKLNELGGKHGIGRLDLVENRYVGMKSRGCYETPGGTILLRAHRAIESITLDREVAHLKDDLMPRYASMIYNGYWWSPERQAIQALIDHTQQTVNGWVRLKLYKGNVIVTGRDSKTDSLFDPTIATFEDDQGAYNQKDAHGFIRLNALRMRIAANAKAKRGSGWFLQARASRPVAAPSAPAAFRGSSGTPKRMDNEEFILGLTFVEFEEVALQVGLTGLILFMVFIIWNLGKESKAGRYGMMWLFIGLGVGFVGFVAKGIIQKLLGIE